MVARVSYFSRGKNGGQPVECSAGLWIVGEVVYLTIHLSLQIIQIISGDSSIYTLHFELRLWFDIQVIKYGGRGATLQE